VSDAWLAEAPVYILLACAAAVAYAAVIPKRSVRASVFATLWMVAGVLMSVAMHASRYSLDLAVGVPYDELWIGRPGGMAFAVAYIAVLAAAVLAAGKSKKVWAFLSGAVIVEIILVGIVVSDVAGFAVCRPYLQVAAPESAQPRSEVEIVVGNRGGRQLLLTASRVNAPNIFLFAVERRIGQNSWESVRVPWPIDIERTWRGTPVKAAVGSGDRLPFRVGLAPGEYRVLLAGPKPADAVDQLFTLPGPASEVVTETPEEAPTDVPPESESEGVVASPAEPTPPVAPSASPLSVELRGLIISEGRAPIFSFVVRRGESPGDSTALSLGDTLYGPWKIREYNPTHNTVTISNEKEIIILRQGEPTTLSIEP
jgi:hypothetical protein